MAVMKRGANRSWQARLAWDDGQDLIEYALAAALIAVVAVGAVTTVGQTILNVFWQAIAAAPV